MKFRTEILIANCLADVTKLFANQENNKYWQSTFIRVQRHSFDVNKSVHFYKINGRVIEVHIHVLENNMPQNYHIYCQMHGLVQKVNHIFSAHSHDQTKWIMETELIAESLILKILMFLLPNVVKKRTKKYAKDFRNFAEITKIKPSMMKQLVSDAADQYERVVPS